MSTETGFDRRRFLGDMATGLAGIAAGTLLGQLRAEAAPGATAPHFQPRAKRVLQIFCPGGVSHVDTWDYKPSLEKFHGQPLPGAEDFVSFQGKNGNLMQSPWKFVRRGETGKPVTELLPYLGKYVDDMAFIHSMTSRSNTHGPGCVFMNTGFVADGFPANGAWMSYALGSLNENLPTYVAITDIRGEPPSGPANWNCGFLPADTLVLWTTEFGCMPTHQEGATGRDHNPDGFTVWMMGAGVRRGVSYGATDEFGRRAVDKVATVYDLYATVLDLLGLDHRRLPYYHNGTARRLTDVHGHVIREVLA